MNHEVIHRTQSLAAKADGYVPAIANEELVEIISVLIEINGIPQDYDYPIWRLHNGLNELTGYTIFKQDSYRIDTDTMAWVIAFISIDEFDELAEMSAHEVDNYIVSILGLTGDEVHYWSRRAA